MRLEIKVLVCTNYIDEDMYNEEEETENVEAIRYIIYESDKDNFMDAVNDYNDNFDFDKMIASNDMFDGECFYEIDTLSIRVLEDYEGLGSGMSESYK